MPELNGYSLDQIAKAVSMVESSGGKNVGPRYEPGFEKRYLRGKKQWESLAQKYGWKAVSSSYGPYQIMFPVAYENGYRGTPQGLADPEVNREYFEKKFMKDYNRVGGDLNKTFLRYNGGGNPNYPNKVMRHLRKEDSMKPSAKAPVSEDPVFSEIERIDRIMRSAGFSQSLGPQEIEPIIAKMSPTKAIGNMKPKKPDISALNNQITTVLAGGGAENGRA